MKKKESTYQHYKATERRLQIREAIYFLENNGFKVTVGNDPTQAPIPFLTKKKWHINEIKSGCGCDHCSKIRLHTINHWGEIEESWWKGVIKNDPDRKAT